MADTKISALADVVTLAGGDLFAIDDVSAASSKSATATEINTFIRGVTPALPTATSSVDNSLLSDGTDWKSRATQPTFAQNTPAQSLTTATDTYITNSNLSVPAWIRVGTRFRWRINITKTAAGVTAPIWAFRFGTAGSTADTARVTITGGTQGAIIDTKTFGWEAVVLTTGATGTIQVYMDNLLYSVGSSLGTGLGGGVSSTTTWRGVSSTFDLTVANSIIGVSVNDGTNAVWTVNSIDTEIIP